LEFLEVARQLEEAVVGVRHGKVDSGEPGGEGGGDPGAERGLPHREPLLPPHPFLLFPLPKNRGNRARRTKARDGIREEEEEESFLWLPLSPPFPLPFLSPLLPPSLLPVAFFGGVLIPETREERDWGAGIEYSLSCLFSPSSLNFCCPSRVVCLALA